MCDVRYQSMNTESYMYQWSLNEDVESHSSSNSPGVLSLSYAPLSFQWINGSSGTSQVSDMKPRTAE